MKKNDKQKVLQVGSLVKVRINKYLLQGTVTNMENDEVTVEVLTYYVPNVITKKYKKSEVKLVSNECPKRVGE